MRRWTYAVVAAVGALGLVLAIVFASGVGQHDQTLVCSKLAPIPADEPPPGETATTLAGAQSTAGFAVLTPDARAASRSNLTLVWANKHNVSLTFAHGKVRITFTRPASYGNARKAFERFVAHNRASATIGRVHQHPALVITPDTDGCGSNPAWVEFERSGIDINIYSASYGTGTLLAIADSLKPRTAQYSVWSSVVWASPTSVASLPRAKAPWGWSGCRHRSARPQRSAGQLRARPARSPARCPRTSRR